MLNDEEIQAIGRMLAEELPKGFFGHIHLNFAAGFKGGFIRQDFMGENKGGKLNNNYYGVTQSNFGG
jgi:hypothetical protein